MQQQLVTMLQLQEAMNAHVNAKWRQQGYEWYRAIWIECAELMDHYGWKWWKKQTPDVEQVTLELIDIWHFGLSIYLLKAEASTDSYRQLASEIAAEFSLDEPADKSNFRLYLERFTETTLRTRDFCIPEFCRLLSSVELSFEKLFESYVGKNVLNIFRQDHGYKEGNYIKQWQGREDNEHLMEVLATLDSDDSEFSDTLYRELKTRYPAGD